MPRQDVGLSVKRIAKGVLPTGEHVVENTAEREHVHRCGLWSRNDMYDMYPNAWFEISKTCSKI